MHTLKTQESRDLTSEGRRRWMSQLLEKEKFLFLLCLLFCSDPKWIRWYHPALERMSFFTQFTDSIVHLLQTHPEIMFYQLPGHPPAQ